MKIIGTIEPEFTNNEGQISNGDYVGGKIVQLSSKEVHLLKLLQDATNGLRWHLEKFNLDVPENGDFTIAFYCVFSYIKARFALNEFESAIGELKKILTNVETTNDLSD